MLHILEMRNIMEGRNLRIANLVVAEKFGSRNETCTKAPVKRKGPLSQCENAFLL